MAREQPADGPDLPAWYAELLGEGLRQELRLPNPLVLDTYNTTSLVDELLEMAQRATGDSVRLAPPSAEVTPSLRGAYVVRLLADGHLRDARVIGGYRTPGFDAAVLGALRGLDSSGELLPAPKELHVGADGLLLRFDLGSRSAVAPAIPGDTSAFIPLFTIRLPRFRVRQRVMPAPFQQAPKYPDALRANHVSGNVRMWFVVDQDGVADPRTLQVVASTNPLFTRAVEDALRTMYFQPLTIGPGCPVRMPVAMPFIFTINY